MRRIILITGLPGSGKTHLGKTVSERLNGKLIDDPNSLDEFPRSFKNALIITDPFLIYIREISKKLLSFFRTSIQRYTTTNGYFLKMTQISV